MRGSRPGERRGGRKPGTRNKRTREREQVLANTAAKVANALGEGAFDGDAHTLLMAVYRDLRQPLPIRIEAAKAALPYEKPRLSTVDAKIESKIMLVDLVNASYRPDIREAIVHLSPSCGEQG
jgi:hypothetical protein